MNLLILNSLKSEGKKSCVYLYYSPKLILGSALDSLLGLFYYNPENKYPKATCCPLPFLLLSQLLIQCLSRTSSSFIVINLYLLKMNGKQNILPWNTLHN